MNFPSNLATTGGNTNPINNPSVQALICEPTAFISAVNRNFKALEVNAGRYVNGVTLAEMEGLKSLEEVRDNIAYLTRVQQPLDRIFHTSQLAFDFSNGVARMVPIIADKNGGRKYEEPLFFDRTAWNQLSQHILARSGGINVENCVMLTPPSQLDEDRRKAMRAQFSKQGAQWMMSHAVCANKTLQFRTVLKRLGTHPETGEALTARFVRAVVSPSYAPYSHLDMLNTMLSEMGNYSVYRLQVGDAGMHFRLLDLRETEGEMLTKIQYPTINGWNSETGQRRTGIGSGTVRYICTNGINDYTKTAEYNWVHRGDPARIARGMEDALCGIRTSQSTLIHEYNRALETSIDDGYAWMENILNGINGISQATVAEVRTAMDDPTGSNPHTLAGVVDGMSLLAQNDTLDLWDAIDLETQAVKVMRKGLRRSDADNKLFAPA